MTTPSNPHVILLHGLCRTKKILMPMERFFKIHGFGTTNINYPSTRWPIEILAQRDLHQALQQSAIHQASELYCVAHSMGAIILQHYLQYHDLPNLKRVVMVAPPNKGSELAQFFHSFFLFKWLYGPAGQQLGTVINEQSLLGKLKQLQQEVGVIIGDRCYNPFFKIIMPSPHDGKVSHESAKLPGMKDFLVVPCGHADVVRHPYVLHQAYHFLRHGSFHHLAENVVSNPK